MTIMQDLVVYVTRRKHSYDTLVVERLDGTG